MDKKNAGGQNFRRVQIRNARKIGLIFFRRRSCVSNQARERSLDKLDNELIASKNALEVEKKRAEELRKAGEAEKSKNPLLRVPMKELSLEQLVELRDKMVKLREKVCERVVELKEQEAANPSSSVRREGPSS
ncbi:hypothetical protein RHMOL_Rhmol11G0225200 [Rhododendron molle]|uniref:Uncharacterized protein n=1 Tax=Rhododendron molle TaxID=49168 RepID=A0ACC0LWU4_RHOML|nr:hypothetical protein RHMOL_Rhmol11G0225200 [Rhododendron molle]